ncbi:HAD family hydrolase [Paenibacillus taiwanensis]|uniref:HAD family hydrolase n=1 Tax=Paenibacillus taiwanensis TaxID=401638 RepID=UPI0003F5040A|nr:HAD family hydrolase [Paenibacillus taiwanensis]
MPNASKHSNQTILFDLDDTLVYCNKYFDAVSEQFLDLMTTWFAAYRVNAQDVQRVQSEYDITEVQKTGFVSEHFPQSLQHTLIHFSTLTGREVSQEELDLLWKLGMSVYETEVEPYPGMIDTLDKLRDEGHELFLYTGGEAVIQQRKIDQMQLSTYFGDRIFIRQHKTTEALESIVDHLRLDRLTTWMIGNSLRTDVLPALTNGLNAIYLKQATEWAYNLVDLTVKPQGAFVTIEKLVQVPQVILDWQSGQGTPKLSL